MVQNHVVMAKNEDKVQLQTVSVENFLEYQQNKYIGKGNPVPKDIVGEYNHHVLETIKFQSKLIYDRLNEAEDRVNTYQSRLLTGIVALE